MNPRPVTRALKGNGRCDKVDQAVVDPLVAGNMCVGPTPCSYKAGEDTV